MKLFLFFWLIGFSFFSFLGYGKKPDEPVFDKTENTIKAQEAMQRQIDSLVIKIEDQVNKDAIDAHEIERQSRLFTTH